MNMSALQTLRSIFNWTIPRLVPTLDGYQLRFGGRPKPRGRFWELWSGRKTELQAAGVRVRKKNGDWIVEWLRPFLTEADDASRKASVRQQALLDLDLINTKGIPCPANLHYLNYQKEAIRFGLKVWSCGKGLLNADEMGLGKTPETIGLINASPGVVKILIVCPNTMKRVWRDELARWLVRPLRVAIQDAGKPWVGDTADIVVINYELVKRFAEELRTTIWDLRVADEAHYLKNRRAHRTLYTFTIPALRKVALTGTPIVNRPADIFNVLHDSDPSAWPHFGGFALRYCNAQHSGYGWDFSGHSREQELGDKLRSTIMIRRLKSEVLDELPAKRRQIIRLDSNGMKAWLRRERKTFEEHTGQALAAETSDLEAAYRSAVRQLRIPQEKLFTAISAIRHATGLAKVPQVIEFVRDAIESEKVIVFAYHLDVIAALKVAFPQAAVITGDVPPEKRQAEVERFQADPACSVFIGNDAAAEGITLTAASHVIFAEGDWVPAKLAQKEDRAHRIGQQESLLCSYIVVEGSLDAYMFQVAVEKLEVSEAILISGAQPPTLENARMAGQSGSRASDEYALIER